MFSLRLVFAPNLPTAKSRFISSCSKYPHYSSKFFLRQPYINRSKSALKRFVYSNSGSGTGSEKPRKTGRRLLLFLGGLAAIDYGLLSYSWHHEDKARQIDSMLSSIAHKVWHTEAPKPGEKGFFGRLVQTTKPYGEKFEDALSNMVSGWRTKVSQTMESGSKKEKEGSALEKDSKAIAKESKANFLDERSAKTLSGGAQPLQYRTGRIGEGLDKAKPDLEKQFPPQTSPAPKPVAKAPSPPSKPPLDKQLQDRSKELAGSISSVGIAPTAVVPAAVVPAAVDPAATLPAAQVSKPAEVAQQPQLSASTPVAGPATPRSIPSHLAHVEEAVERAFKAQRDLIRVLSEQDAAVAQHVRLITSSGALPLSNDIKANIKAIWGFEERRATAELVADDSRRAADSALRALDERILNELETNRTRGLEVGAETDAVLASSRLKKHLQENAAELAKQVDAARTQEPLLRDILLARSEVAASLRALMPELGHGSRASELEALSLHFLANTLQAKAASRGSDAGELNERLVERDREIGRLRGQMATQAEVANAHERDALARQAGGYLEHLAQALERQHRELTQEYETELSEALIDERRSLEARLASWMHRVRGIEAAVEGRATAIRQSRLSQNLFVACKALELATHADAEHSQDQAIVPLKPLLDRIDAIVGKELEVLGPAPSGTGILPDPIKERERKVASTIQLFLKAMPALATERGIQREDVLLERFRNLARVARNVAQVPEEGGGVWAYCLSWLTAKLTFRTVLPVNGPEETITFLEQQGGAEEGSNATLANYALIESAERCIARGDLETTVRLLTRLRGQSRMVSRDWLTEARTALAAQQTAQLLSVYAASLSLLTLNGGSA